MKISNRANLPDALVAAIENDPYTKGTADFSVTELIGPPRIAALKIKHHDDIEEDAEDRLHSLYGQIVHLILERANRVGFAEKRLYLESDGSSISGQLDTVELESGTLTDWKFSTVWKFKPGNPAPEEWVAQLNMQLELLRVNGMDAKSLQIVGLLRDFSKLEARRNPDYPKRSVVIMPIPMWEREKTQSFILNRVILHKQARITLPLCTPEERWARPNKYALMKKGGKRAVKLYDSEADAKSHAESDPKNLFVEDRPGDQVRCSAYCGAAPFCAQYEAITQAANSQKEALNGQKEAAL